MEEIHLVILAVTVLIILFSDHLGWKYFRGTRLVLPRTLIARLHVAIWFGLGGMIVSGILLALPRIEYLRDEPAFYIKSAFVLILLFNAWVIGRISKVATERPFASLTCEEKHLLVLSGAASAISWLGAATIGFLFL